MRVKCPECDHLVGVVVPAEWTSLVVPLACPKCDHEFTVILKIEPQKQAGPSETK